MRFAGLLAGNGFDFRHPVDLYGRVVGNVAFLQPGGQGAAEGQRGSGVIAGKPVGAFGLGLKKPLGGSDFSQPRILVRDQTGALFHGAIKKSHAAEAMRGGVEKYIPACNGLGELRACERDGVRTTDSGSFLGRNAQAKDQGRTAQPYRFGENLHTSPHDHGECVAGAHVSMHSHLLLELSFPGGWDGDESPCYTESGTDSLVSASN